jgi:biopolymer transport protein ExbB/TolQ
MKTLLFLSIFFLFNLSSFGQDINQDNIKEIKKLQTSVKSLQNKNSYQKVQINDLQQLLITNQTKQDSAFGLINNTSTKADESLLSLSETNLKLSKLSKRADNKSIRLHKGKIDLIIILSIMSFGILFLFILLLYMQSKSTKKLNNNIAKSEENIKQMFETFNTENESKIKKLNDAIDVKISELNKSTLSKIDNLTKDYTKKIDDNNITINDKLTSFESNMEKIAITQKQNTGELEKTKASFNSQIQENNLLVDNKIKDIESLLKNVSKKIETFEQKPKKDK